MWISCLFDDSDSCCKGFATYWLDNTAQPFMNGNEARVPLLSLVVREPHHSVNFEGSHCLSVSDALSRRYLAPTYTWARDQAILPEVDGI